MRVELSSPSAHVRPGRCLFRRCDIRKEEEVREMVDYMLREFGRISILVRSSQRSRRRVHSYMIRSTIVARTSSRLQRTSRLTDGAL